MEALAVAGKLQDEEKVKVVTWLIGDRRRMREMFGFELAAGEEVDTFILSFYKRKQNLTNQGWQ